MIKKQSRTLLWDAEITTANGDFFGPLYEAKILRVKQDQRLLCFAYKWLGLKKIHFVLAGRRSDKKATKVLWHLFNKADHVIAYNGDAFDQKHANTRFIVHGLPPPSHYESIDPLKVNRKYFKFASNKMDEVARILGVNRKIQHSGIGLWFRVMEGDSAAIKEMKAYNIGDIKALEDIYLTNRIWDERHPNMGHYTDGRACKYCKSKNVIKDGTRRTLTGEVQTWRCKDCEGYSRSRISKKSKPELK